MKKESYILLIIISVFFSCHSDKRGTIKYDIFRIDSLSIYFPDTIPMKDVPRSWDYHDSIFSFLIDNRNSISIYEYNIYDKNWHCLEMQKEGNYGILNAGYYEYLKSGELLYFPKYTNKFFFIRPETGEILETYTMDENLGVYQAKNFDVQYDNKELLLPVFSKIKIDRQYFQNNKLFALFQLDSQNLQSIVSYPEEFLDFHAPSSANIGSEYFFRDDTIVYSFLRDKYIYVYDLSTNKSSQLKLENPHLKIKGAILSENPYSEAIKRELEGQYSLLIDDTISELTYRISVYYPAYNGKLARDQKELNRMFQSRKVNIMVLNKDFEVIASNDLDGITDALFFTNREGLYLRSMFESEDEYRFIRLGLKKKKNSI